MSNPSQGWKSMSPNIQKVWTRVGIVFHAVNYIVKNEYYFSTEDSVFVMKNQSYTYILYHSQL